MLTSLIIAYFLLHGGSSSAFTASLDQLDSRVKKEVTVDSTRKQALAIVEQGQSANKTFIADYKKYAGPLSKALSDRTVTAAQLDSAVKPFLVADSTTTERIVDMYLALRPVIGAATWAKVVPAPAAAPSK